MIALLCPNCGYPLGAIFNNDDEAWCGRCRQAVDTTNAVEGDLADALPRYEPGTVVKAADSIGGYTAEVLLPAGEFEALEGSGWRSATRVRIIDPAHSELWGAGAEVDVETGLLTALETTP